MINFPDSNKHFFIDKFLSSFITVKQIVSFNYPRQRTNNKEINNTSYEYLHWKININNNYFSILFFIIFIFNNISLTIFFFFSFLTIKNLQRKQAYRSKGKDFYKCTTNVLVFLFHKSFTVFLLLYSCFTYRLMDFSCELSGVTHKRKSLLSQIKLRGKSIY